MSLLDDALKAATALGGTALPSTPPAAGSSLAAGVDLTGAHITLDTRVAKNWSTHLWADAQWSGDHSAGFAIKGTF